MKQKRVEICETSGLHELGTVHLSNIFFLDLSESQVQRKAKDSGEKKKKIFSLCELEIAGCVPFPSKPQLAKQMYQYHTTVNFLQLTTLD